jgi:signal transduction histidine kinase
LLIWDPLDVDERVHVRRITLAQLNSVEKDLAAEMQARIRAQVRLAQRWVAHEPHTSDDLNGRLFLEQCPNHLLVQLFDQNYVTKVAITRDPQQDGRDLDFSADPRLKPLLLAVANLKNGDALISPAFRLADGRSVNAIVVPVFKNNVFSGFVAAVFDTRAEIESMLEDHTELGFAISVLEGSDEIYRTPRHNGDNKQRKWIQESELQLPGVTWRIRVWPNSDLLSEMRSQLPELAAVLGGVLGLLLMLTVHFARATQLKSKQLRQAHHELELQVAERTGQLQHTSENLRTEMRERVRAEDSLQTLSGRLLQLQDEERRRIARELHDSTAQLLAAAAINLDKARSLVQDGSDGRLSRALQESIDYIRRITAEIRTVSYLLHPPMLDDLGLEYVLPWYAGGFSKRSGIAVTLRIEPDFGRVPHEVELTLFRITQEALTNIHLHSGSSTATITLSRNSTSAMLEVTDQGCGLPAGVLQPARELGRVGVGIAGMRERVRQLGGQFEVTSNGKGTCIRAVLPLVTTATPVHQATAIKEQMSATASAAGDPTLQAVRFSSSSSV